MESDNGYGCKTVYILKTIKLFTYFKGYASDARTRGVKAGGL